ncbi:hypothetical protein ACOI9Y_35590, partial [Mesorhizobium japonicum]
MPADNIFLRTESMAREQLAQQADAAGLLEPQFQVAVIKTSRVMPACAVPVTLELADSRVPQRMRFVASCPGAGGWRYDILV